MTFPTTTKINAWFEAAYTDAVATGGSLYTMEKYAEDQVVKCVLRWAYVNLLEEVAELGYGKRSRINNRIQVMLEDLHQNHNVEEKFEDDYEQDDEDDQQDEETEEGEIPMTMETLSQQIVELLIKAVVK